MQHDGFWRVDGEGVEDAGAGLHATLSDIGKLGLLYLNHGSWNGRQLVPEAWVRASTRPDGAHVKPGVIPGSDFGYGYQCWLPGQPQEYTAIGIYNQYVYVEERRQIVIAKISANRNWGRSYDEAGYRDAQHMALFRAIADATSSRSPSTSS
jgi:CubicO group peptidase (beta-lactamase class C family)